MRLDFDGHRGHRTSSCDDALGGEEIPLFHVMDTEVLLEPSPQKVKREVGIPKTSLGAFCLVQWAHQDSNLGPTAYEAAALTAEL